jgi:hypothetical protein
MRLLNIDGQIAKHLEIRKINRNELKNLMISNSDDSNTNSFIKNSFFPNSYTNDGLLKSKPIDYNNLKKYEKNLIGYKKLIFTSSRASVGNIGVFMC